MWRLINIIAVICPIAIIVAAGVVICEFHQRNIEITPLAFLFASTVIWILGMVCFGLPLSTAIWLIHNLCYCWRIRKIKIRLMDLLFTGDFSEQKLQSQYLEKWKRKVRLPDIHEALKNLLLDQRISVRLESSGRKINLTVAGQKEVEHYRRHGTAGLTP